LITQPIERIIGVDTTRSRIVTAMVRVPRNAARQRVVSFLEAKIGGIGIASVLA
jgi:hypothetical protein